MTAERSVFLGNFEHRAGAYLDRLYGLGVSQVFNNATPVEGDPHFANQNVLDALPVMMNALESGGGLMVAMGPMASGKSTAMAKLYEELVGVGRGVRLLKHTFDEARVGESNRLWLQGGGMGVTTDITTELYAGVLDISRRDDLWIPGSVLIIDEFMFAGDGNPPRERDDEIDRMLDMARVRGCKLVVSGLHSDFKAHMWPNMPILVERADLGVIDFRGRCDADDCENNSIFTQRWVRVGEADNVMGVRPSHWNEQVVRVGSVLGSDDYEAMCGEHHQVMTPDDAREFDHELNKDSGDY